MISNDDHDTKGNATDRLSELAGRLLKWTMHEVALLGSDDVENS